jgi:hypothetical protein
VRRFQKKSTGLYSAAHAALGGRTLKTGQSRWFVGYKKHTLRLWLSAHHAHVLLVPLVSWLTPANVGEGGLLVPALGRCVARWSWRPDYVVVDMGYLAAAGKQRCRACWQVAVLTHLRSDMILVAPFEAEQRAVCPQGSPLRWLGYDAGQEEQWFGVVEETALCARCWQQSQCPRQFVYPATAHETLLGKLPLNTRAARFLLQKIRPWIEPAQSYEKNQLGLGDLFLNSLRLTWCWGLLADAVCLLRARALRTLAPKAHPLRELLPQQLTWNWEDSA